MCNLKYCGGQNQEMRICISLVNKIFFCCSTIHHLINFHILDHIFHLTVDRSQQHLDGCTYNLQMTQLFSRDIHQHIVLFRERITKEEEARGPWNEGSSTQLKEEWQYIDKPQEYVTSTDGLTNVTLN